MTCRSHFAATLKRLPRLGAAMAPALLLLGAAPAHAGMSALGLLANAERVDDAELGEMHGKFVGPTEVSFFGITMLTSWQDQNGVTTLARLLFNVDFLSGEGNGPVPMLMIAWSREGDPAMDVAENHDGYVPFISPEQVLPIGDLGSFNGAAQANVIAGEGNVARNGAQIAIVPASQIPEMTPGMTLAGGQIAEGTTSVDFVDGDQLQFRVADNQIGIVLTGNQGLDSSAQLVGGDIGQLLQQSIINSNQNNVSNSTSILFGIDPVQSLDVVRVQEALSSMKGNGY